MVGATIHGEKLWSIKLVNTRQKILNAEESVYEFAKSLDFSTDPDNPSWTVPETWKKLDLNMPFRKATFEIQDDSDETKRTQVILSEIRMGQQNNSASDFIVANINRWRKEMNAEEIINYTINEDGKAVERSARTLVLPFMKEIKVDGRPMYFDQIEGVYQKKNGGGPMMAGMPGMSAADMEQFTKNKKATTDQPPPKEDLPIQFEKPESWKDQPGGSVSIVRFSAGEGDAAAQISVSRFPQQAESVNWQSTVAMWQGQLKVDQSTEPELAKITTTIPVGDLEAKQISITGQKEQAGTALIGIMLENSDPGAPGKWFVKMQGPQATIDAERSNFDSFVKSIRFSTDKN